MAPDSECVPVEALVTFDRMLVDLEFWTWHGERGGFDGDLFGA